MARHGVVRHTADLASVDVDVTPPPWVQWTMITVRRRDRLVLPIGGRRSVYATWPPAAYCESCGAMPREGYVGHVWRDNVHYPGNLRFHCEPCGRRLAGLQPGELTGHVCTEPCTDRLHLELVELDPATAHGTVPGDHPVVAALRSRGWQVADVTRPPAPYSSLDGTRTALWVEPARALPWPSLTVSVDDPLVW